MIDVDKGNDDKGRDQHVVDDEADRRPVTPDEQCGQNSGKELDEGIPPRDGLTAGAASPPQPEPGEEVEASLVRIMDEVANG